MILVIGATGSLDGLITRRLLAGGERIRIVIRKGSPYEPLVEAGAEAVSGGGNRNAISHFDPVSLRWTNRSRTRIRL